MNTFMLFQRSTLLCVYICCYIGVQGASSGFHKNGHTSGHINPFLIVKQSANNGDRTSIKTNHRRITHRSFYPLFGSSSIEDLLSNENRSTSSSNEALSENNRSDYNSISLKLKQGTSSNSNYHFEPESNSLSMFYGQDEEGTSTSHNNQPVHSNKLNNDAELEKAELHINNHQSTLVLNNESKNNNGPHNQHNSRHYNTYHVNGQSLHHPSIGHYNKPYGLAPTSNAFSNGLNLNYIHSLLTKPSSSNTLSGLLNINSNSLSSSYGLQNGYVSSYYSAPSFASMNPIQQASPQQQMPTSSAPPAQDQQQQQQQQQQKENQSPNQLTSSIDFSGSSSCGRQQVGVREPRIVGGNSTFEGEFPWAVSIQRQGNHHCGGVIVGRRWILTAAHCVRSQLVGNLVVRTGGHTLSKSGNHITSHLSRDYLVDQIVMHDDFSRYDNLTASQMKSSANTNNADIALLRLKNDIVWNELAWPVCFPNRDSGNFSGHDATVIGWGKLNEKSEDFSNELQKVKLTIIDNKVCQNWFRQAGREMPIDDRIICAGFKNGGKDACHGDSGGPLLSKINGQYVVVGVVSTGIGCARPLLPGLYSRVSSYIGWIERYVWP